MINCWFQEGLSMYVDGDFVDRDISPSVRGADEVDTTRNNEFMIGRPNDGSVRGSRNNRNKLVMDQFEFWSMFKTGQDIKEIGTCSSKHQYYNVATNGSFIFERKLNFYRPQRSWGKVMFSQACVILFTRGVSASVHAGIPPPLGADTPTPGADTPLPQSMLGDTVNARAVLILLECNLVL